MLSQHLTSPWGRRAYLQYLQSVPLVDASFLPPKLWVLLCPYGLLVLLPTEVLEGWDCPGGKKQLVLQKGFYVYFLHTYTWALSYTLRLVPLSNSSVPSHTFSCKFCPTILLYLKHSSQVISFFLLWERGSGFFILHSVLQINYTYIPTNFNTLRSYHMLNLL